MNTYATRDEAIGREIIEPIEATDVTSADEFDIDAIADEVLAWHTEIDADGNELVLKSGYRLAVDGDEFWTIVENHAR